MAYNNKLPPHKRKMMKEASQGVAIYMHSFLCNAKKILVSDQQNDILQFFSINCRKYCINLSEIVKFVHCENNSEFFLKNGLGKERREVKNEMITKNEATDKNGLGIICEKHTGKETRPYKVLQVSKETKISCL